MSTPVLLVHGIDDTSARLQPMRVALESRGIGPVRCMDIVPSDASISIQAMAEQVEREAHALLAASGARGLDIVGYSMGALVARWFIQQLGGRSSVRRFVSISGPHHGTATAYLRNVIGAKQMRPGSTVLRRLDEADWGDVDVISFWSRFDLMVIPAKSSRLEGARNRLVSVAFHRWMITDRRMLDELCDALDE